MILFFPPGVVSISLCFCFLTLFYFPLLKKQSVMYLRLWLHNSPMIVFTLESWLYLIVIIVDSLTACLRHSSLFCYRRICSDSGNEMLCSWPYKYWGPTIKLTIVLLCNLCFYPETILWHYDSQHLIKNMKSGPQCPQWWIQPWLCRGLNIGQIGNTNSPMV